MTPRLRIAVRLLGYTVALAALAMIGRLFVKSGASLTSVRLSAAHVAGMLLFGLVGLSFHALLWRATLARLGLRMPLASGLRVWTLSQLTRYAPAGGVWQLLSRGYLTAREGGNAGTASASLPLEVLIALSSGLLVALGVHLFRQALPMPQLWLPVLAALLVPLFWKAPLQWIASRLKVSFVSLPARTVVALLAGYAGTWLWWGLGLCLLVQPLYPLPLATAPILSARFALAWITGFLAIVTPSGLGVRELVMAKLFAPLLPAPAALALPLLARLWLVTCELLGALLVHGWHRLRRRS